MKILLVHNSYQQPGGEDVVFEHERLLLESSGHQVTVYRRSNWEAEEYVGVRRIGLAKRTIWASDTFSQFESLLRDSKPDVVHVHNTFLMISPSIYSACHQAGVPVIQTLHNYRLLCPAATFFRNGKVCRECVDDSLWRSIEHACYRDSRSTTAVLALMLWLHRMRNTWGQIACFVALTEFSRNQFVQAGFPAEKIFVKPNFVHPDPNARSGDGDYALFVGRLSPEKRVSTVLKAWKHIRLPIPMRVLGGGPDRQQLEHQAVQDGLNNIIFEGQVSRERTLAAINNARFLVFSSEWYENFPVTIAEAFACNTPVIASRMGAMQEIVSDGRTGLHFTPGNYQDLAEKVEWAWTHPEQMREIGRQARNEYESKYTAAKNYPILMDIYNRALSS